MTKRWRGVKNLNEELDCYNTPIDHSRDIELGILQTKGCRYNPKWCMWPMSTKNNIHKGYDNLICCCINQDGTIIERIYIIPSLEVTRKGISIPKTNRRDHWYDKYRVTDNEVLRKVNEIWKQILEDKCK